MLYDLKLDSLAFLAVPIPKACDEKREVLLIYASESPAHRHAVHYLSHFLEEHFHCRVHSDLKEEDRRARAQSGDEYTERILRLAHLVLIVDSPRLSEASGRLPPQEKREGGKEAPRSIAYMITWTRVRIRSVEFSY